MRHSRLSLRALVFVGGSILMLVPAIIAGVFYTVALQRHAETMLSDNLKWRGELASNLLARRLHHLWQEVDSLSKTIASPEFHKARDEVDFLGGLKERYSWVGVADVEGRVVVSTGKALEGENVGARPWFRRGLSGPTAVDVHEALLLAKLMPERQEPYRFIDFAAPIRDTDGSVAGVIGAHLDWNWVVDNLKALQIPGIELFLLSRDRDVLFGPPYFLNKSLGVGSAQAASRVTTAVLNERWPDGKDYVTVVVPTVSYADLPSFGWSLLVRQDMDQAMAGTRMLVRSFWAILGLGALAAMLLLLLGAHWITTPLRRLAHSAEQMVSESKPKAPYAESRYDEAARLSTALVRLQSKLMR